MAKDIPELGRQVYTPAVDTGRTTVYAKFGEAAGKLSELIAGKLSEQAAYQSGLAGEKAVQEGKAPDTLMPPFTQATRAYNEAVLKAETRQLLNTGREQILKSFAEMSSDATFNEQTPALFAASIKGITNGILEGTRPENRGEINAQLNQIGSQAQIQMYGKAVDYDNRQAIVSFEREIKKLQEQLDESLIREDKPLESVIRSNINEVMKNYGDINQKIKDKLPDIQKQIDDDARIATYVGQYNTARLEGRGDNYLFNFEKDDIPDMTMAQKYQAMQKMIQIKNGSDALLASNQAQAKQILVNDMLDVGSPTYIGSIEELKSRSAYDVLNAFQQEQVTTQFFQINAGKNAKALKIARAENEIAIGRAGAVDKGLINEMFNMKRTEREAEKGAPLDLAEQLDIVRGFKTNVPDYDKLIGDKLTSRDVPETLLAGKIYATALINNETKLINLKGPQEAMALRVATLYNGTVSPPEESVKQSITSILDASLPQIAQRNEQAKKIVAEKGPAMFKEMFGAEPNAMLQSGAYKIFQEKFLAAYAASNSEAEAVLSVRNGMRSYGESKHFKKGYIGRNVPEKELPLAEGTPFIKNQMIVALNRIVKENNKLASPIKGAYPIEIVNGKLHRESISQYDLVYNNIDEQHRAIYSPYSEGPPGLETTVPVMLPLEKPIKIKVNGHESEVYLMDSPQTAGAPGVYRYGLFYDDRYGIPQQLTDPSNQDGLAYIALMDVDKVAPELFENERLEERRKQLNQITERQYRAQIKIEATRELAEKPLTFGGVAIAAKIIEKLPGLVAPRPEVPTQQLLKDILERNNAQ